MAVPLAPPQLRIWLLGVFRVVAGNRVIHDSAWRLRRAHNLIKLLALAPYCRLHKEQVIEALLPELDPDQVLQVRTLGITLSAVFRLPVG